MAWVMTAAALAAVAWGFSDFFAGLLARRLPVLTILIGSKIAAMLLAIPFLALRGIPPPDDPRLLLGVGAGLIGVPAMGLLYRSMRDGSLAVVAPIAAVAALVPVAWGMLHGERLGLPAALGVVIGLAGVTMASWPVPPATASPEPQPAGSSPAAAPTGSSPVVAPARRWTRRSADLCALGAALGFGINLVLLHEAGAADKIWSVGLARITAGVAALILLAAVAARAGRRTTVPGVAPGAPTAVPSLTNERPTAVPSVDPGLRTPDYSVDKQVDQPVHHPHPRPPRGDPTPPLAGGPRYPQVLTGLTVGTAVSIALVGASDALADTAFIQAAASALAPAAVVSSLYPAVTLLLTTSLLRERLHTVHLYGVLAALFAVACLAR